MRIIPVIFILFVFNSDLVAGINEWTYVGLAPEYINSIVVDPTNSDIIYVSAYDVYYDSTAEGGLFRTADRGLTWDTLGFRYSNVHDVAVDPVHPWIVWIANDEWGAWRSEDYGDHWENRSNGIYRHGVDHWGPDKIAVCPHDSRYLICLTDSWVGSGWSYFTDNSGEQWQPLPGLYVDGRRWVVFDPSAPGVVYLTDWNRDFALISQDTGRSFTPLPPYGFATVFGLETAPSLAGAIWRTTHELGLQKSTDFGQTWARDTERFFGTDTSISDMDVVGAGDTLAFATWGGAFLTFDGGDSVFALPMNSAPETHVFMIRIISKEPLEIWTVRNGIWTYTYLPDTTYSEDREARHKKKNAPSVFPNPFNSTTQISFEVPRVERVSVKVYNLAGQLVRTLADERMTPGVRVIPFDGSNLPSGTYFYRLSSPEFSETKMMMLVK